MTMTLTRPAVEVGACVHFESVAWCALCTGKDRKGINPLLGMGRSVEVYNHSVRVATSGGYCPSCDHGFGKGTLIGYSPELVAWVPTSCCGIRVNLDDPIAASYFNNLRGGGPARTRLPDTDLDDHRNDQ